jgi:hypothetical protein
MRACVLRTDILDGTELPTSSPSTDSPLSLAAASSERLVLIAVHIDVQWSVASLLGCSMRFAALCFYCALALASKILLLLVWHPRSLVAICALGVAAAILCCEDDENSNSEQGITESGDAMCLND